MTLMAYAMHKLMLLIRWEFVQSQITGSAKDGSRMREYEISDSSICWMTMSVFLGDKSYAERMNNDIQMNYFISCGYGENIFTSPRIPFGKISNGEETCLDFTNYRDTALVEEILLRNKLRSDDNQLSYYS